MNRNGKALIVLLVAAIGLWGCSQGPGQSAIQAERIKALEIKCAKLEDDYKAAASARDQARRKITTLEEERRRSTNKQPRCRRKSRPANLPPRSERMNAICSRRAAKR